MNKTKGCLIANFATVPTGEGQRRMLRGHGSDDALAGGASVVVRDGESPLHGEGKQFECVCDVN
ncbi:hypothetical protein [Escherichia coli]|uniref:hypothetical protein n=1 Tax=Escherichia coli TaxID=562 RepID=UPI00131A560E|nr:hypothetical protein [Escherichia coli]